MYKSCGCSYQGGCACSSPPEKTLKEKMESAIKSVMTEHTYGVEKIERDFKYREAKLCAEIVSLKEIIQLHKVTDVRTLKEEIKILKGEIKKQESRAKFEWQLRDIFFSYNPKLKRVYAEISDGEFKRYAKSYFTKLHKGKQV